MDAGHRQVPRKPGAGGGRGILHHSAGTAGPYRSQPAGQTGTAPSRWSWCPRERRAAVNAVNRKDARVRSAAGSQPGLEGVDRQL